MGLIYALFVGNELQPAKERSYSKVRTVNMSADDGDAGPRSPVLRDRESEQGTLVPEGRRAMVKWYYRAR